MADRALVDYIKNEEARGYDEETLRKYLIKLGHDPIKINEAITVARVERERGIMFPGEAVNISMPASNFGEKKTSSMAAASFVFGILFFIPLAPLLAVVFGILGLGDIRKKSLKGMGMAVTGVILGMLAILASIMAFIYYSEEIIAYVNSYLA